MKVLYKVSLCVHSQKILKKSYMCYNLICLDMALADNTQTVRRIDANLNQHCFYIIKEHEMKP